MTQKAVLVVGAGLIGASAGLGLIANKFCCKLGFIDINQENLELSKNHKYTNWVSDSLNDINSFNPDIIIVATPTLSVKNIVNNLLAKVDKKTIITDVASTKSILADVHAVNFIAGHPIAGHEDSGFKAADISLFKDAKVILCPNKNNNQYNIDIINSMWGSLGAKVVSMDAEHHDRVFAYTSHLPHLVAYSLINSLLETNISKDIFDFAGGGLNDFTRIAASDPIMWHDICLANKNKVLESIENLEESILHLKSAIKAEDSDKIKKFFSSAKQLKQVLSNK